MVEGAGREEVEGVGFRESAWSGVGWTLPGRAVVAAEAAQAEAERQAGYHQREVSATHHRSAVAGPQTRGGAGGRQAAAGTAAHDCSEPT